ncbi:hypothetical protein J9874_00787 [Duffyella gerundensis]|uniref:Uncharacterized protein n=1 Tax=Duffyella gerundensis TaxID=1619313 RepID=A0A0U5LR78_9GAMM|nr:YfgG family protein [Duffyella gerundensis]UCB30269.1 hypothetical protein J9874_00787 [Duffyella gerundensis]CUU24892.1 hypothetical protein EM595_2661 [Duffyella gerundensis]
MNNALPLRRRQKTSTMTRIVLLISFLILFGRLIFLIPAALEHYQQQQTLPETPGITTPLNQ